MKWYKINFPDILSFNEASIEIRKEVQAIDFIDAGKNGIAMYVSALRTSQNIDINIEENTIYFPESSKKLLKHIFDRYNAVECAQPDKNTIAYFYVPSENDPLLNQ